jgi:nicotinamide mononucleotide transporter
MSGLEWVAVVVTALGVWATGRRQMWCWPVSLASVALYAVVFVQSRLYSDALLQAVFGGFLIYGWGYWLRRGRPNADPNARPAVRELLWRQAWRDLLVGAVGAVTLGAWMAAHTDAALPWLDAVLAAYSLVAQYWLARLHRANWLLWITVDLAYVGVYLQRGLYPTAALYLGFIGLAVYGWRCWQPAKPVLSAQA